MKLEFDNLYKSYGNKEVLKGITATMDEGIYALLGPNGAGKSTLMNILTGNLEQTKGEVLYDGMPIGKMGKEFRALLGYMPQQQAVYPNFTVQSFLAYMAALKDMKKVRAKGRIPEVLQMVGLASVAENRISSLSGGMKQRLLIAQAILDDPAILILDEPTAGLDPNQRIAIRNMIAEIAYNKIVLIATHVVSDIELIAKEVMLLRNGILLEMADRDTLTLKLNGKVWEIISTQDKIEEISGCYKVGNIYREQDKVHIRVVSDEQPKEYESECKRANLEDVYLYFFDE